MKTLTILLLLLLMSGCATTKGPDSPMLQPAAVIEQPAEIKQSAKPLAPETKYEEPRSTPIEKALPAAPPAITPRAAPSPPVAKATPPQHKDFTNTHKKLAIPLTAGPSGLARLAAANDEKLIRVYVGMDRATVEHTMASAHNPAKRERITGSAGQAYEILFYLTREPRKGKPITERLLTPVIFRNNEVVAIGNFRLEKLRTTGSVERKKRGSPQP